MRQSRFSDSQVLAIIKQNEQGVSVADLCIEWRGKLSAIHLDNGPEYISQSLVDWANSNRITLMYIQPGKRTQNAYIERYNNERPNSAIGGVLPRRLLEAA